MLSTGLHFASESTEDVIAVHQCTLADDKRLRGHRSLHGGADPLFPAGRTGGELTLTLTLERTA